LPFPGAVLVGKELMGSRGEPVATAALEGERRLVNLALGVLEAEAATAASAAAG
jgi:hypothetical protein